MNRSTDLFVDGKRHILVADDEMINRELLENILCGEYDVIMAEDGEMAYDLIREKRNTLSLILLDLMMPGIDGFEVIRRLRENPETADIRIVILSALNSNEDVVKGFNVGADDFIMKPIIMEKLLTTVITQIQIIQARRK